MEAGNTVLSSPQCQDPFLMSQSIEKHKSEIPKSRSNNFWWCSTAAARTAQETNFGDLAPVQPMPAKEQKAEEES